MGVSILWQPIYGRNITPGSRSEFADILDIPRELGPDDIVWLEGVAAGRKDFRIAITELIDAIHKHGRIRVWGEY